MFKFGENFGLTVEVPQWMPKWLPITAIVVIAVFAVGAVILTTPGEAEATQGRAQPIEDGYQTTLKGPNGSETEVFCLKGEVIYRSVEANQYGISVALQAPGSSAVCRN